MSTSKITLASFQSFDDTGATVDHPKRFNIFAGPNNVGKSKLLQAISRLRPPQKDERFLIDQTGEKYRIRYNAPITERIARQLFPEDTSGGHFGQPNWWDNVGKHLTTSAVEIEVALGSNARVSEVFIPENARLNYGVMEQIKRHIAEKPQLFPLPYASEGFLIAAERDVSPEPDAFEDKIMSDGRGVTTAIRKTLHSAERDHSLVRKFMLDDLNRILHPDFQFKEILARQHGDGGAWEIFLVTTAERPVRLSQSGSGLKTLFCLLANIHIKLQAKNKKITSGVFVMEELENSLHPRVQRNTYQYLREKFSGDSIVLMSTHSPIAIDFFQADSEVALYSVSQQEGATKCRLVEAFDDKLGLLDLIGAKASDALMSNFVIWVEGPSDRIYVNKWLQLGADRELREGREYSVMFYGGKLLSHLSVSSKEETDAFIKLLRINPRCAVLIDSDKAAVGDHVNATKNRIAGECYEGKRFCWITQGREIENYLSNDFLVRALADKFDAGDEYTDIFADWPERLKGKAGIKSKIELALFAAEHSTKADYVLDWQVQVGDLVRQIVAANQ
jgi:energy-coupling factor transporter ATP-binding protein EcfA2